MLVILILQSETYRVDTNLATIADAGISFLPRIESVFYAVFDLVEGPKIVYQVPEGLIATNSNNCEGSKSTPDKTQGPPSPSVQPSEENPELSTHRPFPSTLKTPGLNPADARQIRSPKRKAAENRYLFHFDDISKYVIPNTALYGRLVVCTTHNHKIIGFPVELYGRYQRNYFRFNLCLVFDRSADLSCFEPIIRKIGRVLTACEDESEFLSSPENSSKIYAVLEQLYEDLNSYRETSIPIDKFNSIELKLIPFYPNPPPVKDWQVPYPLIDFKGRISPNWDLTIAKVCEFIDGVNHIARIAQLADCDIALAREAIAHLKYYQVIMMVDVFQFSNIYTLRKCISSLASEDHVASEAVSHVGRQGAVLDWPSMLHLYSRLKPGITVYQWMQEYDIYGKGVDVRRFISFGVVKGFLRRMHRWPVLLSTKPVPVEPPVGMSGVSDELIRFGERSPEISSSVIAQPSQSFARHEPEHVRMRPRAQEATATLASVDGEMALATPRVQERDLALLRTVYRESAAERAPPHLQTLSLKSSPAPVVEDKTPTLRTRGLRAHNLTAREPGSRRHSHVDYTSSISSTSTIPTYVSSSPQFSNFRISPDAVGNPGVSEGTESEHSSGGRSTIGGHAHNRSGTHLSKSPSGPTSHLPHTASPFPPALIPLLDGEHHTDELCVRFNVGWPMLEQWLVNAGGGEGNGDFGNVCIIYR
ncbi:hypothetical protein QCA50_003300 [Cerrena zonata]|uniref:NPR2-domain-containing protein n=1 Tax=Cerrena zonata TaxID=2478898 RepID=A0AAW0GK49_9APHY